MACIPSSLWESLDETGEPEEVIVTTLDENGNEITTITHEDQVSTAAVASDGGRAARIARIARLFRLLRMMKMVAVMMRFRGGDSNPVWNRFPWVRTALFQLKNSRIGNMFKLFFSAMLLFHFLACSWYLLTALHADISDTWVFTRYLEHDYPGAERTNFIQQPPYYQW